MRKATHKDIEHAVGILTDAFVDNNSVNFVVKQDERRIRRIEKLMRYSCKMCLRFGEVWMGDDGQSCALLLFPHWKKTTWQSIFLDAGLAFFVIGITRVFEVMKRESLIKRNHPKEPFCHLWFIGVSPQYQKHGNGSTLLQSVIDLCKERNQPIYLETSMDMNLGWYKKFGFGIFETIDLTYKLYLLRKLASL